MTLTWTDIRVVIIHSFRVGRRYRPGGLYKNTLLQGYKAYTYVTNKKGLSLSVQK